MTDTNPTKRRAILSYDTNSKTVKGRKKGFATGILYLAPSDQSGVMNTCKNASKGCRESCLFSAGRGAMPSVIDARVSKTVLFFEQREFFMECLEKDIVKYQKKAEKGNLEFVCRLNGTSDLNWEEIKLSCGKTVFEKFPEIQFYDYTKSFKRMVSMLKGEFPSNYHLTFSKSESNVEKMKEIVKMGGNVAVVFGGKIKEYLGRKVVDGDESDLRFLDGDGIIVGLQAKGKARYDKSGFVVTGKGFC
jgi:hypothetical protein